MKRPWEAERTIGPDEALALIAEQFPDLKPQKIKLLGVGWDNIAYLIDDAMIFRFPKRLFAVPLIDAEVCVIPKIAPLLPLPVPVTKWAGRTKGEDPWPYAGYLMLPGTTACRADLSSEERSALATPIGRFLKTLHAIPLSVAKGCPLPTDPLIKLNVPELIGKIRKNLEELALIGAMQQTHAFDAILDKAKNLQPPTPSAILHGDLYARHLLVDEARRLTGVIDWGDVHIGDPAADLAIAHSFLPTAAHEAFRNAYGPIPENRWKLAHLRGIYSSTLLLLYGHHTNDAAIAREGRWGLEQTQITS